MSTKIYVEQHAEDRFSAWKDGMVIGFGRTNEQAIEDAESYLETLGELEEYRVHFE